MESVLRIKDTQDRSQALETMGTAMARSDIRGAFATVKKMASSEDKRAMLRGIFHFLGQGDRARALSLISAIGPHILGSRETAFEALVQAWGLDDSEQGERLRWTNPVEKGGLLLESDPPQIDLALAWAEQLGEDEGKPALLEQIAKKLLATSPGEALELGNQLQGDEYVAFLNSVTSKWAEIDPQAALTWSMQITDPTLRANLQQTLAENLAPREIGKAQAILQTAPPGSFRDSLLASVAGKLAYQNTDAAFRWAAGLSNPSEKARAEGIIQDVAPVGIGAALKISDGLPQVASLMENAPAALSRQLKEGDRIIAVDTMGNGQFISTQGMELDQVTKMIRGRAGTAVRLQVSSINADGFDPVRTVWLSRAQLRFVPEKPPQN